MSLPQDGLGINTEFNVDYREQLFNEGKSGPVNEVSTPTGCITSLSGILLDFDPKIFRSSAVDPDIPPDSVAFYENIVRPWLDRHDVARNSELRMSGTGLHSLVRFKEPVVFRTDSERKRWGGIVKVIQASLPTDPDAPGINALTRPIGSINSKSGATVTQLTPGQPVEAETVVVGDFCCWLGHACIGYEENASEWWRLLRFVTAGIGRACGCVCWSRRLRFGRSAAPDVCAGQRPCSNPTHCDWLRTCRSLRSLAQGQLHQLTIDIEEAQAEAGLRDKNARSQREQQH